MARQARVKSLTGIYHIMSRGIDKRPIFHDIDDKNNFIYALKKGKEKSKFGLYAYCLMDNHFHLLLEEREEPIASIMKRVLVKYAYHINKKYNLTGPLFADRFKSYPVETEKYLLQVIAYIHRNPIVAGLCNKPADYYYSSYSAYINLSEDSLVDRAFPLEIFGSLDEFVKFMEVEPKANFHQCDEFGLSLSSKKLSKIEAMKNWINISYEVDPKRLSIDSQREIAQNLYNKTDLSVRDIGEILDMSKSKVHRLISNE